VDQRLRYALGLLSPVLAHEVACDYVERILPSAEAVVDKVKGPAAARVILWARSRVRIRR
jgi:hypothetical protein